MRWRASFRKSMREKAEENGLGIAILSVLHPSGARSEREVFVDPKMAAKIEALSDEAFQEAAARAVREVSKR